MSSSESSQSSSGSSSVAKSVDLSTDDTQEKIVRVPVVKTEQDLKWEAIQAKAFLHWINGNLQQDEIQIESLTEGFADGVNLILFIQTLSGKKISGYTKRPELRVHKITNCFIALKFLEDQGVKDLMVSADDIVDASADSVGLLLDLCWVLLRHFSTVGQGSKSKNDTLEKRLLKWITDSVSSHNIVIEDFNSLKDGKAILAILEKYDKSFVNFEEIDFSDGPAVIDMAVNLSENLMGIPTGILDPKEMETGDVKEENLFLFSALLYNQFQKKLALASKDSLLQRIKEMEQELKDLKAVLEEKKREAKDALVSQKDFTKEMQRVVELKTQLEELKQRRSEEWMNEKNQMSKRKEELQENFKALQEAIEGANDDLSVKTQQRKAERDDLAEQKTLLLEKLATLKEKKAELQAEYEQASEERLSLEKKVAIDQQSTGSLISKLALKSTSHVDDMNTWKVFLSQNTRYKSEDIQQVVLEEIEELDYSDAYQALETKLKAENDLLKKLLAEQLEVMHETQKTFKRQQKKTRAIRAAAKEEEKESAKPEQAAKKERAKKARKEKEEKDDGGDRLNVSDKKSKGDDNTQKRRSARRSARKSAEKTDKEGGGEKKKRT